MQFLNNFPQACHKIIRKFRLHLARMTNTKDNLTDCVTRLFLNSSPSMRSQRPKPGKKRGSEIEFKYLDDRMVEALLINE